MTRTNNTDLKDIWQTPDEILSMLGDIDLDPCAGELTDIGDTNYRYPDTDGLEEDWFGTVFVNPPFSDKSSFLEKAVEEKESCDVIYVLTPDSTDTKSWWHKYIASEADYIWFSEGRISYIDPSTGEKAGSPTFGTAISAFGEPPQDVLEKMDERGQLLKTVNP
jgi:phage N-6-adenine-methyltransferase